MSDTKVDINLVEYVASLRKDAESRALHGDFWAAGRLLSAAAVIEGLIPPAAEESTKG